MGLGEFKTLNALFLLAAEKRSKPECFLFKSEGRYQALSLQDALLRVAALASVIERRGSWRSRGAAFREPRGVGAQRLCLAGPGRGHRAHLHHATRA